MIHGPALDLAMAANKKLVEGRVSCHRVKPHR